MKTYEAKLYDAITDSAKKAAGFDYNTFRSGFDLNDEYDEIMADNMIWFTINSLQIKTPKEIIAYELLNQFMAAGFSVDLDSLKTFVADKDVVFKKQIGIAKLATDMLNDGVPEQAVYTNMIKLLQ